MIVTDRREGIERYEVGREEDRDRDQEDGYEDETREFLKYFCCFFLRLQRRTNFRGLIPFLLLCAFCFFLFFFFFFPLRLSSLLCGLSDRARAFRRRCLGDVEASRRIRRRRHRMEIFLSLILLRDWFKVVGAD